MAEDQPSIPSSPAASDKTTIVSVLEPPVRQKSKPPRTLTNSEDLVAGQKPPESEPQLIHTSASSAVPPLVVRSDKIQGVVDYARRMLENSPTQYHCFFPQCGYTIHDAWDDHDIQIDSAEFLTEVLIFITRDNVHRAQTYAYEWSQKNRHRLDFIAGEVPRLYNVNDPLSIVDKIFIDGETQSYPRLFLWHVANIMRTGMVSAAAKSQVTTTITTTSDTAKNVGEAEDKRAGNNILDTKSVDDATAEDSEPRAETNPSGGTRRNRKNSRPSRKKELIGLSDVVPPTQSPLIVSTSTAPSIFQPPPATSSLPTPPFVPSYPDPKGYQTQPAGYVMGGSSNNLSPHMNASSMRLPKSSRNARRGSGSGSYNQPLSHQGRIENHPTIPMSGHHPRPLSGSMSATHSPYFTAPLPVGVHPIMNTGNPMMPFPQYPAMTSPSMGPSQLSYGPPMMHPAMMPSQSMPYGGSPMEFAQHNYPQGPPMPRAVPIGDMTNNVQHPYSTPPRRAEQIPSTNRRMSYTNKQTGLYNPYGAEKPDFGIISYQQGPRKGGRNSLSNPSNRGRKGSVGSYHNPGYGQHPFDRIDRGGRNGPYAASRQHEAPRPRSFSSNNSPPTEVDLAIINDKERGCNENWVGPNADYVTSLWVCNLPRDPDPTPEELTKFFEATVQFPILNVQINLDKHDSPIAYINFQSSDGVRKGLALDGHFYRGRPITVKVPRYYYMKQDPTRRQSSTYYPRACSRVPHTTSQLTRPFSQVPNPTHYPPQDVRSGLSREKLHSQASEVPERGGSPKAQNLRKMQKSPDEKEKATRGSTSQESSSALVPAPTHDKVEELPCSFVAVESIVKVETDSMKHMINLVSASTEDVVAAEVGEVSPVAESDDAEPSSIVIQSAEGSQILPQEPPFTAIETTHEDVPDYGIHKRESSISSTPPLPNYEPVQAAGEQPQDNTAQEEPGKDPLAQEQPLEERPVHGQTLDPSNIAASASQPSLSEARSATHTALEEEDKNDVSYHSAQEMQSDSIDPEEEEVPTVASDTRVAAASEIDTTTDHPTRIVELSTTDSMMPEPEKPRQATNTPKKAAKTESLSIFAVSRAQKKKEKGAQKKEKRKTKAVKTQSSMTPMPGVPAKAKAEPSNCLASLPAAPHLDSITHANTPIVAKMESKNGQVATSTDSQLSGKSTNDDGVSRDEAAIGGKTPIPHKVFIAETRIPQVHADSSAQPQDQDTGAAATFYEPASEFEVSTKNTNMLNAAPAHEEPSTKANEKTQHYIKKSKPASNLKVAIPNLKDMERKSPDSSKGSAIDSSYAKSQGNGAGLRNQTKLPNWHDNVSEDVKCETGIEIAPETASVASSITLQGIASPIMSPSPTGSKFHTPVQTPTALAPKKKKKKSKPKKKMSLPPEEAFAGQMHEIEKATGSLKGLQEIPYYDKHAARPAETPEESAFLDKQIADASLMPLVQAYYPQKESSVQPQIEPSFDLQNQNAATYSARTYQPLSSTMLTEVIEGRETPRGQQILEEDDGNVPKAETVSFFQPDEAEG